MHFRDNLDQNLDYARKSKCDFLLMEAEKKRKKPEEDAKRVRHGVGIGDGWEVLEGKTIRIVELTPTS